MRYLIVLIVSVLLLPNYLTSQSENMVINGEVKLSENSDNEIKVFAVYYGSKPVGNLLIDETTVDKGGKFSLQFPSYIVNADVFIVSPGFKSTTLEYIKGDDNPFIKANLIKNKLSEKLDSAKIVIQKNDLTATVSIPIDKNMYSANLDISSKELETLKLNVGDTIQYYYNLNDKKFTPIDSKDPLIYEKDYIYFSQKIIKSKTINFGVDFNLYLTTDSGSSESNSKWVNSPVNQQYSEIIELLPKNTITQLNPNYIFIVRQTYPDVIKDLSKEKLDSMKQTILNDYNRFMRVNDSLMIITKSSYLYDYLSYLKLDILKGPVTEYTISAVKSVLESSKEVPIYFKSEIVTYVYSKEFYSNPDESLNYIEQIISKTKDPIAKNELRYMLYSKLAKSKLSDNLKYLNLAKTELELLMESEYTMEWTKGIIKKSILSINLKMSTDAPDFSFKSLDGKNHNLSEFKGKWVILDFWGTWCVPCQIDTPYLLDAYKEISRDSLEIISISSDKSMSSLTQYIEKKKITWINTVELEDYASGIIEKYGVSSYPTLFLIDPKGQFIDIESSDLRGEVLIPNLREEMAK